MAYKLKGVASAWWEQVQQTRNRSAKSPVRTWVKMKKLLKNRFLPPDFEQVLYRQFQSCRQGNRSVPQYTEEFYRLKTRLDLNESEAFSIARYKEGLKWEIEERLAVQSFHNLGDIVLAAQRVEQLMERGKSKTRVPYSTPTNNFDNPRPTVTNSTSYNGRASSQHISQDRPKMARDRPLQILMALLRLLNVTDAMRKVTNQMYVQNKGQLI